MMSTCKLALSQCVARHAIRYRPRVTGRHALHCRCAAAASTPTAVTEPVKRERRRWIDAAEIGAQGRASVNVTDLKGPVGLDAYMHLPPEQYSALDPSLIQHVSGNAFQLHVPRIQFFNVWVQPTADVTVDLQLDPPAVVLTAQRAEIRGSDLIESLGLTNKFELQMVTKLTWQEAAAPGQHGQVVGDADLTVVAEVVPPFDLIPREILKSSCNAVLAELLRHLLPAFMQKLGSDYQRWSRDAAYRAERAAKLGIAAPL